MQNALAIADFVKAAAFYLGIVAFSMGASGLICILVLQATLSLQSCVLLLALAAPIWAWACWRSDEPATRTFATMLIYSSLWIALIFTVALLKSIITNSGHRTVWYVGTLLAMGGVFWYLRAVVIRRNKEIEGEGYNRNAV
jgi:hypothetical protein